MAETSVLDLPALPPDIIASQVDVLPTRRQPLLRRGVCLMLW
ncbi:MAG: hypothetical protein ABI363_05545 [Nitrosospira sp.]